MKKITNKTNSGYTLLDLSIALVITGALIAGVAGAASLIHTSKLQSVAKDMADFNTAYANFRDRYQAVPGDMKNAYDIWGTRCSTAGAAYCNGNGDGVIQFSSGPGNEVNKAWKQLGLAGMLGMQMTDDPSVNNGTGSVVGKQIPASKIAGAGYVFIGATNSNTAMFGSNADSIQLVIPQSDGTFKGALTPQESYIIDSKIDDGNPTTGMVRAFDPTHNSTDCSDVTTNTYTLTNKAQSCALGMVSSPDKIGPMTYFGVKASTTASVASSAASNPGNGTALTSAEVPSQIDITGFNTLQPTYPVKWNQISSFSWIENLRPDHLVFSLDGVTTIDAYMNMGYTEVSLGQTNNYAAYTGTKSGVDGIKVWSYDSQGNTVGYSYSLSNVTTTTASGGRFICSVTALDGTVLFQSQHGQIPGTSC